MITVPASPMTTVALPKVKLSAAVVSPESAYTCMSFTRDIRDIAGE
ncbi:hypothetical protein [Streptomyces sp. NBC_01615]